MKIIVSGRNIDLTKAIKDHVTEKFRRLEHHFDFIHEVHVFLSVDKNPSIKSPQHAEATIHVSGAVIRVEEANQDMYTSIDRLVERVDRSLSKHKTKLLQRAKSGHGGESIRRTGFAEAVAETEQAQSSGELFDEEKVYLTFSEDEEGVPAQPPARG